MAFLVRRFPWTAETFARTVNRRIADVLIDSAAKVKFPRIDMYQWWPYVARKSRKPHRLRFPSIQRDLARSSLSTGKSSGTLKVIRFAREKLRSVSALTFGLWVIRVFIAQPPPRFPLLVFLSLSSPASLSCHIFFPPSLLSFLSSHIS